MQSERRMCGVVWCGLVWFGLVGVEWPPVGSDVMRGVRCRSDI